MNDYRVCRRCIMDTSDPTIMFDKNGLCNHCTNWFEMWKNGIDRRPIADVINQIIDRTKGKYHGIVGISGGVDSSYVAYLANQFCLDILLVHVDDGWNTAAAAESIEKIVDCTGYPFKHIKINQNEYHDLIRAYMKANLVGIEVPTDNALRAIIFDLCNKYNINNILSGNNWTTEGILPAMTWGFDNSDVRNLKAIHKRHGLVPLKETKLLGIMKRAWKLSVGGMREFRLLNHLDPPYNRENAKKEPGLYSRLRLV